MSKSCSMNGMHKLLIVNYNWGKVHLIVLVMFQTVCNLINKNFALVIVFMITFYSVCIEEIRLL